MKRSVVTMLSVVSVLLACSAALADQPWSPTVQFGAGQIMSVHFTDDAIGAQPATGTATPILTKFVDLGDWDYSPPSTQYGAFAVANVAGMDKACVTTTNANGTYNGYANLWADSGISGVVSHQMALSFDIAVMAAPAAMTNTAGNSVFYLRPYEGIFEKWSYRFVATPTSESGGIFGIWNRTANITTTFGTYVEGQKYNIAFSEDFMTGTVDAYVDGALALDNYATEGGPSTDPRGGWTRELYITMQGEAGYSNQVALDNVEMYVPLAGDADMSAAVNVADLTNLLNNYNKTEMNWDDGDFDEDGSVNVADLTALLNNYNKTVIGGGLSMSSIAVPEPSSIAMLAGLALTALLCWRRKQA